MSRTLTATITAKTWDEARYDEAGSLAQADYTTEWTGDIVGESASRLLLAYTSGDPADLASLEGDYVGMERVTARIGERSGSFVLQVTGVHRDGAARSTLVIVPGSATGELAGLTGQGSSVADAMSFPVTFTVEW